MITNFCEIDIKFSGINQINIEAVGKYCIVLLLFRTHDRWIDRKGLRIAKIVENSSKIMYCVCYIMAVKQGLQVINNSIELRKIVLNKYCNKKFRQCQK